MLFVYFGLVGVSHTLPNVGWLDSLIGGVGFILINYFKVNPSSNYNSPEVQAQPIPPQ